MITDKDIKLKSTKILRKVLFIYIYIIAITLQNKKKFGMVTDIVTI